jgi:hypothetical protein
MVRTQKNLCTEGAGVSNLGSIKRAQSSDVAGGLSVQKQLS